ncbi:hypothetical protein EYF80_025188 [Liparis tanakae]|uniref:Uncharacterized protein n=1 Tax=Liparis tanakae TaxID=230148 RepID=A0A4Z2HG26_9TELE|nr:hypothetical protein EYF80_025188 [Liparis tanakae]
MGRFKKSELVAVQHVDSSADSIPTGADFPSCFNNPSPTCDLIDRNSGNNSPRPSVLSPAFPLGSHLRPVAFSGAYCGAWRSDTTQDPPQTVRLEIPCSLPLPSPWARCQTVPIDVNAGNHKVYPQTPGRPPPAARRFTGASHSPLNTFEAREIISAI